MNSKITKQMFKAIEGNDMLTLNSILDANPEALEAVGEHDRLVRDKTPLMYAMQCANIEMANALLNRGANAAATMPGGPKSSVLSLCMQFAYSDQGNHDAWIPLANRLIDNGADPNSGLWPALHAFGGLVRDVRLVRLCLERGADQNAELGNSGNTIRELVEINRQRYSDEVLDLFRL